MFTVGLVIVLIFLLVVLGKNSDGTQLDNTLEIVEIDDDDTKTLRNLIRTRR